MVAHPYKGLSNKQRTTEPRSNLAEAQKHYATEKKPEPAEDILRDSTHVKFQTRQNEFIGTENRPLVACQGGDRAGCREHGGNVVYLACDGWLQVCIRLPELIKLHLK